MICLDTNVLKYGFYPKDKEHLLKEEDRYKVEQSRKLLEKIESREVECVIPSIVLAEYESLVARYYPSVDAGSNINSIKKYAKISWLDESEYENLRPHIEKIKYKGADSVIAGTTRHYDAALATYDRKLTIHLETNESARSLGIRAGTPEDLMREGMI